MTPSRAADLTPHRKEMLRAFVLAVKMGYDFSHIRFLAADYLAHNGLEVDNNTCDTVGGKSDMPPIPFQQRRAAS